MDVSAIPSIATLAIASTIAIFAIVGHNIANFHLRLNFNS
jgi:hypothetical protein